MLLMIDNYDSFTYNLVQYFGELGENVIVIRNDQASLAELIAQKPDYVVISPGPCDPSQAGISMDVIQYFGGRVPVLGVCLGHQAIGQVFGGRIVRAPEVMHGKTSLISHDERGVFFGLNQPLVQTRYHSLVVDPDSLPECLKVTAWAHNSLDETAVIRGLRHKIFTVESVQFHPESIASEQGHELLKNFLTAKGGYRA